MSFKGMLLKAGIETDGQNVTIGDGIIMANNILAPSGASYYVNDSVTESGDGGNWDEAFKTLEEALAVAGDFATIYIEKGTYDAGEVLNIDQTGLRLLGRDTSPDAWGGTSIQTSNSHTILTINASDVEIAYLSFVQNDSSYMNIDISTSIVDAWRTHIHHCSFGEGTYGVRAGLSADAADAPHTVVEDCVFLTTAIAIDLWATFSTIRRNHIKVYSDNVGVQVEQHTVGRGWLSIMDNTIVGFNDGDTGIKFSNSPTESRIIMAGNRVKNCATPVTAAKYTSWYDGNYWGVNDALYHPVASKNAGREIFVDKGAGTTGLDGLCWKSAFLTITEGIEALADNDTVRIAEGFYTEAAELTITESNVKIIGSNSSGKTRGPCCFKTPTAAGPMLIIDIGADDVEISNVSFIATSGHEGIQLGGSAAGYIWRTHIHDCAFFGDDIGTYAIACYDASVPWSGGNYPDTAECVVENCHFYSWATASIAVYGTRAMFRHNTIFVHVTSATGISVGCNRGFVEVTDNIIIGNADSDVGILLTDDLAGNVIIFNNCVSNCGTDITQDVSKEGVVNNPTFKNGDTFAQVDAQST